MVIRDNLMKLPEYQAAKQETEVKKRRIPCPEDDIGLESLICRKMSKIN